MKRFWCGRFCFRSDLNGYRAGHISYVPDLSSTPQVRKNRKEDTIISYPAFPGQGRSPRLEGFVVFVKWVGGIPCGVWGSRDDNDRSERPPSLVK